MMTEVEMNAIAKYLRLEIIHDLPKEISQLLPTWARVVRICTKGYLTGRYALWDTRRFHPPFTAGPSGAAQLTLRAEDRVVDIGAYIGTFAFRCLRAGVASIRAYEPNPLSAAVLRLSIGVDQTIKLFEQAVIGVVSNPLVPYFVNDQSLGLSSSLVKPPRHARQIHVQNVAFSDVLDGATVMKIDAEGCEYDFPWMDLKRSSVRAILISFHDVPDLDWRNKAQSIIDCLEGCGFIAQKRVSLRTGGSYNSEGCWVKD